MTILYDYWRSSASYRVRIALHLIQEPFKAVSVDLVTGDHRATKHLARHPQGLVPVLEIDGHQLTQSLAIIEYLNETRRAGFLPDDPKQRAEIRALSNAIAMEIHPILNLSIAKHVTTISDLDMNDWMHAHMPRGLAGFEAMLGQGGAFCHGDVLTMADLCLVPQAYNARRWGVDLSPYPRITAILANLEQIDAVAAAHPDNYKPTE